MLGNSSIFSDLSKSDVQIKGPLDRALDSVMWKKCMTDFHKKGLVAEVALGDKFIQLINSGEYIFAGIVLEQLTDKLNQLAKQGVISSIDYYSYIDCANKFKSIDLIKNEV